MLLHSNACTIFRNPMINSVASPRTNAQVPSMCIAEQSLRRCIGWLR
jgi:hypothetical protein